MEQALRADFEFRDLGAGLALASMCWRRLAADGRVIETLGATYILRRTPDWRIVTLIGHTPGRGIGAHA